MLVKEPSGRHTPVDWVDDVNKLAEQFINADIFAHVPGIFYHTHFPGFPKSCLSSIDLLAMKRWVYAKLEEFRNMNIYEFNDIVNGIVKYVKLFYYCFTEFPKYTIIFDLIEFS